mgnify:CR=1 FL=1
MLYLPFSLYLYLSLFLSYQLIADGYEGGSELIDDPQHAQGHGVVLYLSFLLSVSLPLSVSLWSYQLIADGDKGGRELVDSPQHDQRHGVVLGGQRHRVAACSQIQVTSCCCLPCNHCSNGHGLLKKFWPFW